MARQPGPHLADVPTRSSGRRGTLRSPVPRIAIIGAGISGLATAHFLREHLPAASLIVLEGEDSPGGKSCTIEQGGYRFEGAANGFVSDAPDTLDLIGSLGLDCELIPASPQARRRLLYSDGGLRPLPSDPPSLLRSELLSLPGKLRAAAEPLLWTVSPREESVHDFVARHFGHEAARVFAGPLVLGVAAGDAGALSVDALFPNLRALERSHGSVVRGMIARRRRGSRGRLTGFRSGIGRLIAALASGFAAELRCGAAVERLEALPPGGLRLTLESGEHLSCDIAVVTTPADVAAQLLRASAPAASVQLAAIPYAGVRVFGLGFERIDVPHLLDGFGFLVPRGEGVRSLGVLWSSSLFPERAPEGRVLLRVIAGGAVDPEFMALSEGDALEQVLLDLRATMGISVAPEFARQIAWRRGIPQYLLGHRQRVAAVRSSAPPGVFLVGDAYDGVGVNDCIRAARRVAGEIAAELRGEAR